MGCGCGKKPPSKTSESRRASKEEANVRRSKRRKTASLRNKTRKNRIVAIRSINRTIAKKN